MIWTHARLVLAITLFLLGTLQNTAIAKTITEWRSEIKPGKLSLNCERSFNLKFERYVSSIAKDKGIVIPVRDRKGLVDNMNEIVELMSNLRKAGFTITGPKGEEEASIKTTIRMQYRRNITISINENIDRAGFNLEVSSEGGKGRIDQKNVTQYATAEMQEKIKASYGEFKNDIVNQGKAIRRALNNRRYDFTSDEIRRIKNDKRGAIVKSLVTPQFCDRKFKIKVKATWRKYKQ